MVVLAWNPLLLLSILIGHLQAAPREVNGIVGGSALLSLLVSHGWQLKQVRWKAGPGKTLLGDSNGRSFVPFNLTYNSKYSGMIARIVMGNETALMLTNLKMEDTGIFKAEITLSNGDSVEQEFQLHVYDSVPVPFIEIESFVDTSDGCNITLACQVPSEQNVSFTWAVVMPRDNASEAAEHIANGTKLQLSVSTYLDQEYICFVRNPVDHKQASISPVCPTDELLASRVIGYFLIPAVLIPLAILGLCIYLQMWKKKKRKDEALSKVELVKSSHPTIQYTEVMLCAPEENEQLIEKCISWRNTNNAHLQQLTPRLKEDRLM
ncbi:SLAM family member 8-like isoform X3 [Ambystoma mexicanum]|uniref:SLAM family member 8-like isoform X3 n=1 Tax=Ambystoma mexicanum TaxID=8296 RepID=UPI0037E9A4A1